MPHGQAPHCFEIGGEGHHRCRDHHHHPTNYKSTNWNVNTFKITSTWNVCFKWRRVKTGLEEMYISFVLIKKKLHFDLVWKEEFDFVAKEVLFLKKSLDLYN